MVGGVTLREGDERLVAWRSVTGDTCPSCGEPLKRVEMTREELAAMSRWYFCAATGMPVSYGGLPPKVSR